MAKINTSAPALGIVTGLVDCSFHSENKNPMTGFIGQMLCSNERLINIFAECECFALVLLQM